MSAARIGELLLENALVTEEQVAEALRQKPNFPNKTLGQILRQLGYVSKEDLDNILDLHRKRQKLGEILIKQKIIDEGKLHHALAVSKKEKTRLGDTLIKLRYIEEQHLANCIASQFDIPFLPLKNLRLESVLARYVNVNFAYRHQMVAVSSKDDTVTIAMAFPLEKQLLRDVERAAKVKVQPVIAMASEIAQAQKSVYRTGSAKEEGAREFRIEKVEEGAREKPKTRQVDNTHSPETEQLVRQIVATGLKFRASDIHLESTEKGLEVRYRVDGFLQPIGTLSSGLDPATLDLNALAIVSKIKVLCKLDIAERRRPQDGSFRMRATENETVRLIDFRVSTLPTEYGEDLVIRTLDRGGQPLTLAGLGLNPLHAEAIRVELETPSGFFLVTGPTGCGKSATMHAMLSKVNRPGLKTMAVADPIEYTLAGVRQAEVNEAVGNTFSRIIKTFMRQDPDNIMVGEIRDPESAALTVRAALNGHTVFSTLQTTDAASAVVRLLDMGVNPNFIASTLRCVLAQRLIRTNCNECKESYTPTDPTRAKFSPALPPGTSYLRGKGCPACNFTGFRGRRPISELWIPSEGELLHICQPDHLSLRQLAFMDGGRSTMLEDGVEMVKRGETTLEELLRVIPISQLAEIGKRRRTGQDLRVSQG